MRISTLYSKKKPVLSFEVFPPKREAEIEGLDAVLEGLCSLNPDFISVTCGAGGTGSQNRTTPVAAKLENTLNKTALAHLTCVMEDEASVCQKLQEMREDGITNVLALRGDLPPDVYPKIEHASDLIKLVNRDFCVGAACYPEGHITNDDISRDIGFMKLKQELGAEFFLSQLFFDNDVFLRFMEKVRKAGITASISAGVMPILGRSQIERLIFMCGASLPSKVVKLLYKYESNPVDLRKAGIENAALQINGLLRNGVDGVHVYTMNKIDIAKKCVDYNRDYLN